jgi:hypothetical protein
LTAGGKTHEDEDPVIADVEEPEADAEVPAADVPSPDPVALQCFR